MDDGDTPKFDLEHVTSYFDTTGRFVSGRTYGTGHINDTFLITCRIADGGRASVDTAGTRRYILQRINHHVFREPDRLMENVLRVTSHMRGKMAQHGRNPDRNSLTLIPTKSGDHWLHDGEGNTWRHYIFIENTVGYDIVDSAKKAYEGGRAFGEFQRFLVDLPGDPLHETIPDFHNMRVRLNRFSKALDADAAGRASSVKDEISFVESRASGMTRVVELGERGEIEARITHNDTKINNVLLDAENDEAVCVIDLDTVMPGYVLYDFGDSIRTATNTAAEDEPDTSKVAVDLDLFGAYTAGYLSQAGAFLDRTERSLLSFSARMMTFIIGLRFFTDHLEGDHYFKIHHPDHNLQRARAQFALLSSMEAKAEEMERIVEEAWNVP